MIKIISGSLKGRIVKTVEDKNFRPTMTKIREALFSILTSGQFIDEEGNAILENACIVDLFAGSGALSFEAISRGASKAILIDMDSGKLEMAKENAKNFKIEDQIICIKTDFRYLPKARLECDIAFIDPPYNMGIINDAIEMLDKQGWLKTGAIVVVELSKYEKLKENKSFDLILEKKYSKTNLIFLQKK